MAAEDHSSESPEGKKTAENPELEDFFHRLPSNFRWPKPSEEAIAAAAELIQRMAGDAAALTGGNVAQAGDTCSGCGNSFEAGARYCSKCGLAAAANDLPTSTRGPVHHHHHYHHFVPAATSPSSPVVGEPERATARGRVPGSPGTTSGGRAELSARQVAQDWAQACNTKQLDDLVELYSSDATLIRSNVPPVRSLPAVREFLHSLLEAGLGELEMESLRTEVMGEIAMDLGRCKMLVPVSMGKRREERGKYLLILARQPAGTWKILADSWSSDQAVSTPPIPESARKSGEPATTTRKPR